MGELARQFGQEVRTRRRARGLTQAQLAEAAGLSEEWVRRMERGGGTPSFETLEAMGTALGVPVGELFVSAHPRERARITSLLGLTAGLTDAQVVWLEDLVRTALRKPGPSGRKR
jgi:transcriptional regulator with XRE-family HTH domain